MDSKPSIEHCNVSKLDFRVGKIVAVTKHPNADYLLVNLVDIGEDKCRTVVSGLRNISLEQMQHKFALFMCNIKPAKIRGILSEAIVMIATSPEKLEILNVPKEASIGDRVIVEGYSEPSDTRRNLKIKVWKSVKPDFRVDKNKVANYKGAALKIEGKGDITAPTLADAQIE